MEGIDRAERVAGWHARLTAAYAPASTEGPEADDRGAGSGPAATTSGAVPSGSSTLEARDAEDLGLDDVLDESALEAIEEVVRQKVDRARKKRRTRSAAPEAPVESDEAAGAATPTGPDIAFIRKEFLSVGSLYDCFNEWADALPIPVERIEVHLRVRDGQVKRVIFDQGLTPPRCVRDGLEGREIGEVDGTYTFTLHLVHG